MCTYSDPINCTGCQNVLNRAGFSEAESGSGSDALDAYGDAHAAADAQSDEPFFASRRRSWWSKVV
jgi:hypothetical protein